METMSPLAALTLVSMAAVGRVHVYPAGFVIFFLVLAIGATFYFLPTIIAAGRGHPQVVPIFVINVLLGWTLLGWVATLAWSVSSFSGRQSTRERRRPLTSARASRPSRPSTPPFPPAGATASRTAPLGRRPASAPSSRRAPGCRATA